MAKSAREPAAQRYLFVGTYGHVVALNKTNGRKAWTTSLPRTGYSVVSIVCEDGKLYCAAGGRVFALDPDTGEILWSNGLKGLGTSQVYLTTARSDEAEAISVILAEERARRSSAAATAHSH